MRTRIISAMSIVALALCAPTISRTATAEAFRSERQPGGQTVVKPRPRPYAVATATAGPRPAVQATEAVRSGTPIVRETILADASTATDAELEGVDVVSIHGDSVGEIDSVVTRDGARLARIGVGGFLGFGETEVMVPVRALELIDAWTFRIRMSPDEVERRYATDRQERD